MKKPNDNKLDKLFRDGLTDPKAPVPYREADWENMARLLDGKDKKKSGIVRLGYYLSGIAALLLLAFGLFFLTDNQHKPAVQRKPSAGSMLTKRETTHQVAQPKSGLEPVVDTPVKSSPLNDIAKLNIPAIPRFNKSPLSVETAQEDNNDTVNADLALKPAQDVTLQAATMLSDSVTTLVAANSLTDTAAVSKKNTTVLKPNKKRVSSNIPTFALAIIGAPDVNTVNSIGGGQVGSNFSLQLSVRLTNKLSITTGAGFAVKPYQSAFSQYKSNFSGATPPTNVVANCQVLDVPINLNYQLYTKGSNSFTVGTGLSSYFMLKERYQFDYAESSGVPAYNFTIVGRNQHVLGVLNLNATYQRRINSKFSAVVQPYLKLPLTGIGEGQVNLRSTGVAIGFNWNINLLKKPK